MITEVPLGYLIEYRPGDPCIYNVEEFQKETYAYGGLIRGLYISPQPGCDSKPAAYRCLHFWTLAKYWKKEDELHPATPLYMGPVLHNPYAGDLAPNRKD